MNKKIVIALGGNALGKNPNEQLELLKKVATIIVSLIKEGYKIVLTHGNGPQVGQIALAMDYSASGEVKTPNMPFPECGSMSQGYIGYHIQQSIQNELKKQKINKNCITVITQVLVDKKDNAFNNPTKPIGMFYSKEEANRISKEKGFVFVEDSGRGYRRVVPSPKPIKIVEKDLIKQMIENDNIIIAAGGGGIPVIEENYLFKGVEAVIDKDRSAALLAKEIDADILLILTSVDKVYINYNNDNKTGLRELNIEKAIKYIDDGQFARGSMLPKVEACIDFVKNNNSKKAIIGALESAYDTINGKNGTIIHY